MSRTAAKLKKILLPVDVSRDSLCAVHVAFDLAAALGAEVSGLFVEDTQLLAAGSLPLAREVGSSSGISRRIGSIDIHKRFQAVACRARELLAQTADRMKVRSSFHICQGDVSSEILSASSAADMLVIGKAGWALGRFGKPGRTCLSILAQSQIPVMIVEQGVTLSPSILAVHDDSEAGRRAVEFAHRLGEMLRWEITVFTAQGIPTGDDVLERIHPGKSYLIILPSSLPLGECAHRLKSPVLFVP
jgi:nucleotide-binding universal stress UspA family protein